MSHCECRIVCLWVSSTARRFLKASEELLEVTLLKEDSERFALAALWCLTGWMPDFILFVLWLNRNTLRLSSFSRAEPSSTRGLTPLQSPKYLYAVRVILNKRIYLFIRLCLQRGTETDPQRYQKSLKSILGVCRVVRWNMWSSPVYLFNDGWLVGVQRVIIIIIIITVYWGEIQR